MILLIEFKHLLEDYTAALESCQCFQIPAKALSVGILGTLFENTDTDSNVKKICDWLEYSDFTDHQWFDQTTIAELTKEFVKTAKDQLQACGIQEHELQNYALSSLQKPGLAVIKPTRIRDYCQPRFISAFNRQC